MSPHPVRLNRRKTVLLTAALLVSALACNYPRPAAPVSAEQLRQTLQAGGAPQAQQPSVTLLPSPASLATSSAAPGALPTRPGSGLAAGTYIAQPGDTLPALAKRFKLEPEQLQLAEPPSPTGFLPAGKPVGLPVEAAPPPLGFLLPDAELVYSPAAAGYDIERTVAQAGGFLSSYQEWVNGELLSGAQIVERVADESSVNPRLLLAFLDFRSGWLSDQPKNADSQRHPLGFFVPNRSGLYQELVMAATHLNLGYYGWRSGDFDFFKYANGATSTVNPWLNPGSVGLLNLFAKFYNPAGQSTALSGPDGFLNFYTQRFGDPWTRTAGDAFFPPAEAQPALELPFLPGERWALTGGPHPSWNTGSPRGALDLAPVNGGGGCQTSTAWATAAAPGLVTRAANNVVALDLDGDGSEQTGWVLIYLHIANQDMAAPGSRLETSDRIGHPSCERGKSTGLHVHIARKYNGEWLAADGPLPFVLSGWQAEAGQSNYQGALVKGEQRVQANPGGPRTSIITR